MQLPYDPVETLQTDGIALIELVREHDHATEIADCPGWTLGDLARHQGEVWHLWGQVLAQGITDEAAVEELTAPSDATGPMLVDWMSITHNGLYSALVRAGLDQEVWTWTGSTRDSLWVRRRVAQSTAFHRFDAARAVGDPYEVPTVMAADGIDEFLTWFAGHRRAEGAADVGGTVHLHGTDTGAGDVAGGEWFVASVGDDGCDVTREHRKGDAAVRGRAHDLLAWLWRRDVGGVEVIGDASVAERFRAFPDLT